MFFKKKTSTHTHESQHFMLSVRSSKRSPQEFGLSESESPNMFIRESDGTIWIQRDLYDFGWGKEYGFFKTPMPDFYTLINIIVTAQNDQDKYGAASVILDEYCDELLTECLRIINSNELINYVECFKILQLDRPQNRSNIYGKSFTEIKQDYEKWKLISEKINQLC